MPGWSRIPHRSWLGCAGCRVRSRWSTRPGGVAAVATSLPGWSFETRRGSRALAIRIGRGDFDDEGTAEAAQAIVDRNLNKP